MQRWKRQLFDVFQGGESNKQRDESGLAVLETLSENRKLLENGEIINSDGSLWGFRLYKATSRWDEHRSELEFLHSWDSFSGKLTEYLRKQTVEDPFVALAKLQRGASEQSPLTTSWTRNPNSKKFGVYQRYYDKGLVVSADVPLSQCLPIETIFDTLSEQQKQVMKLELESIHEEQEIVVLGPIRPDRIQQVVASKQFKIPKGYDRDSHLHYSLKEENQLSPQDRLRKLFS